MAKHRSPKIKGEEPYFIEGKKVGRGCFEQKSIGKKQEFRVVTVSHWLSRGING